MKITTKDAAIVDTSADEDFPGTFDVILSAPTEDRDGETLRAEDWVQPLPDHITFDTDHAMSVAGTVGSGVPSIDEKSGNLVVSGTYSSLPRAQEARTLVKEKHIRTVSVAYMTHPGEVKDGKRAPGKRELLNGAFVAIPSNREALVLASKALAQKAGARNSSKDLEQLQSIHDLSAGLGADCAATAAAKAARRGVWASPSAAGKSVAGSLEATQDRVRDALNDLYGAEAWIWLRATIPASDGASGIVVFEVDSPDGSDCEVYQQAYTDDGSVVALTGTRTAVDLVESIRPDPDEETQSTSEPAPAAPAKAAPAPATLAPDAAEIQVRAARIAAQAALAQQ